MVTKSDLTECILEVLIEQEVESDVEVLTDVLVERIALIAEVYDDSEDEPEADSDED